jgi:hypothetical protein
LKIGLSVCVLTKEIKLIYWMKWPEATRIIARQRQCDSEVVLMFEINLKSKLGKQNSYSAGTALAIAVKILFERLSSLRLD